MNRILLLDKRLSRQREAIREASIEEEELNNKEGLVNVTGNESIDFLNKIQSGDFSLLDTFSLFILHESDLNAAELAIVSDYCSQNKKSLILFSGGIQQNIYNNEGFEKMYINSNTLYSPKLISFCDDFIESESKHLTELIYGDMWELNYALIYRQLRIDQLNGDDFIDDEGMDKKLDLLTTCESILGEKNKEELDRFIDDKMRVL